LIKALQTIFPERDWKVWKFQRVSRGYWNDASNRRKFLLELATKIRLNKNEWNSISTYMLVVQTTYSADITLRDFLSAGGFHFYHLFPSFGKMLKDTLPELALNSGLINDRSLRKRESLMAKTLQEMFPEEYLTRDYSHPDIIYTGTNRRGQLDVFVPSLAIAFEYQVNFCQCWRLY
jgi:hypothetical protein